MWVLWYSSTILWAEMKLNIQEKYYKICIKKKKEWKTVFQTRYELYEYQVMSFRLTNALATFQELINHVLYDYLNEFVIAYLNNILIYFKNEEDHEKHVKKVLKRFQEKKTLSQTEKMWISQIMSQIMLNNYQAC